MRTVKQFYCMASISNTKTNAMKQFLLLTAAIIVASSLSAQKKNKSLPATNGFAITAVEKGGRSWKEVRMIDAATGEILKTVYDSKQETEPLNARTGKPIAKKQPLPETKTHTYTISGAAPVVTEKKKTLNLDQELEKANGTHTRTYTRTVVIRHDGLFDKSFAGNSAAMAYDKKLDRLYYTPMSINQLRYIDLKTGKLYFFENEAFGVVNGMGDVQNQITRMVVASDGNGYALTNNANHLIRFTTGKNVTITDLGAVTDDAGNQFSVHSKNGYGGDMVADASGNLYLLTANRNVFKINIERQTAQYIGAIKGLPQGFSTNGAMVEGGSKVIIASSESTTGYYRFDLNTLESEKVSQSADVFNASDLANGNLAFEKQKKEKKQEEPKTEAPVVTDAAAAKANDAEGLDMNKGIAVFPNPVTNGNVNLSFTEQPAGKYQVQLLDMAGRLISSKEVNINSDAQIENFRFPELSVKGSYLLKITNKANKVNMTNKIVVQ